MSKTPELPVPTLTVEEQLAGMSLKKLEDFYTRDQMLAMYAKGKADAESIDGDTGANMKAPAGRIRFDYTNGDGNPDCKIITHDEMRQRYADLYDMKYPGKAKGGEAVPVAWQSRRRQVGKPWGDWYFTDEESVQRFLETGTAPGYEREVRGLYTHPAKAVEVTEEMVGRFLGWKLPKDFHPDAGISFTPYDPPEYPQMREQCWPIGTNLLTAVQARAMLEFVVGQGATEIPQHLIGELEMLLSEQPEGRFKKLRAALSAALGGEG